MINLPNMKACSWKEKDKVEALTILVMADCGKDNGCIICKMEKDLTSMLMGLAKKGFGD